MAHGRDPVGSDVSELREERHFLLLSLLDLDAERDAGDIDNESYVALRDPTSRSGRNPAASRRSRVAGRGLASAPSPAPRSNDDPTQIASGRYRPRSRAVVLVTAVGGLAIAIGLAVAHEAGQRLPGSGVSGSTPQSEANRLMLTAANDVQRKDIVGALKAYQAILKGDPANPQAAADMGWLIAITGNSPSSDPTERQQLLSQGLKYVQIAERDDPAYADPHFYAGSILMTQGKPSEAAVEFAAFLGDDPPPSMVPIARQDLQTAETLAAGRLPPRARDVTSTSSTVTPRNASSEVPSTISP